MSFKITWRPGLNAERQEVYRSTVPFTVDTRPSVPLAVLGVDADEYTDSPPDEDTIPYWYAVASIREQFGFEIEMTRSIGWYDEYPIFGEYAGELDIAINQVWPNA